MTAFVDSMGFGHGPCGHGPCGHGPWVTFPFTPGYPYSVAAEYAVDVVPFESQDEQRFARARERGMTLDYRFPRVDSADHTAMGSWFQALGGPATRVLVLDHRTSIPYVARLASETWDVARGPGLSRETAWTWRVARDVTYASVVMADSPVAYWRLGDRADGVPLDHVWSASFVGSYGTGTSAGSGLLAGDYDRAVANDASHFTARVAASSWFHMHGSQSFTYECWAWTMPDSQNTRALLGHGPRDSQPYVYLAVADSRIGNRLQFEFKDAAGTALTALWDGSIADRAPHHVVLRRDWAAGAVSLHVDGTLVASKADTLGVGGDLTPVGSVFILGGAQNVGGGLTSGWPGTLDEVAVYRYALSDAAIRRHYQAGARP